METNNKKMYVVNDISPAFPVHPGDMLGEELKARSISCKSFAETIGIQASHLSALIHGARNFTPSVAEKIEKGLPEIPANIWVKLQDNYNKDIRRRKTDLSLLVSGYGQKTYNNIPTPVLAEESEPNQYHKLIEKTIKLPVQDLKLLELLSQKIGWIII